MVLLSIAGTHAAAAPNVSFRGWAAAFTSCSVFTPISFERILMPIPGDATIVYVVADASRLIDHPLVPSSNAPASRRAGADAAIGAALKRTVSGPAAVARIGPVDRPLESRWIFVAGVDSDAASFAERINNVLTPAMKEHALSAVLGTVRATADRPDGGIICLDPSGVVMGFRVTEGMLIADTASRFTPPSESFADRKEVRRILEDAACPESPAERLVKLFVFDAAAHGIAWRDLFGAASSTDRATRPRVAADTGKEESVVLGRSAGAGPWMLLDWSGRLEIRMGLTKAPFDAAEWMDRGSDLSTASRWFAPSAAGVATGRGPVGRILGLADAEGMVPAPVWVVRLFRGLRELSPRGAAALAEQLTGEWAVGLGTSHDGGPSDECWVFTVRDASAAMRAIDIAAADAGTNSVRNDIAVGRLIHFRTSDGMLTLCVVGDRLLASAEPQAVVHGIEWSHGATTFADIKDAADLMRHADPSNHGTALLHPHQALLLYARMTGQNVDPAWIRLSRSCPLVLLTATRESAGWTVSCLTTSMSSGSRDDAWRSVGAIFRKAIGRPLPPTD